ncbi:alkaline phosphatase [Asanoa ishikariensis]|uniref:PhoD-like phosphatase n=1 Tax=Asanoa ishikariensis TaxID=137265 RepID=A0A1H3RKX3_9ACTN|nr:alkaline phosphatase D family protein [Asanoa ishikariensis]GIF67144.1 alkaline phosphatase [Asanoa ishikariensis]SDZ25891.1 PhoD-like phosphatase [Asanoa ishikariensis]
MSTARLLIGPVLRRVVDTRATIWVETATPAVVTVRAEGGAEGRAHTFTAFDHHYALVVVEGLPADAVTPYEVFVDEEKVWPEPDSAYPRSVIRTRMGDDGGQPVKLVFGSCREATPRSTGHKLPPDALDAFARRLMADEGVRPDLLVLLGDQVYADMTSKEVRRFLRKQRKRRKAKLTDAPPHQVVTFHEYTQLYLESWRDPEIRWLLSTVPSVMIFDDHEIIDDWNSSASWRVAAREQPWWGERITSGLASYWVYQHLGNLHPDELAADALYPKVVGSDDATEILRDFGQRVDREADAAHDTERWRATQYQWSYRVDLGRTRLVVLDNRCSRVLDPDHRAMLPPGEWSWFLDQAHGDYDHLVVGSSLPWLLPHGIHHLEAWNERLAASDRGFVAAGAERLRRAVDLEHWAAFQRSFEDLAELFARIGSGPRTSGNERVGAGPAYPAPASISVLSGDVHHSYVARVRFRDREVSTPVHQLTCSPIHNAVPAVMKPVMTLGWWRGPSTLVRALAKTARVRKNSIGWRKLAGPYFGNAVSTLSLSGLSAAVTIEGTRPDGVLTRVASLPLTEPAEQQPPVPAQKPGGVPANEPA